jgi:uncharacterized membrane protein
MFWLALGYPLFAHLSVVFGQPWLQWLALTWLLGTSIAGALAQRRGWAWLTLLAGGTLLYWLVVAGNGLYALYVPPALIPAALFLLFARSLRAGDTPLVTRIARHMHGGTLPQPLVAYTRHVTQLWCVVCACLFLSAVLLALFAPAGIWSLMTNLVHYLVLGAVFVLEFAYRRLRYAEHENFGLVQYLRRLARTNLRM